MVNRSSIDVYLLEILARGDSSMSRCRKLLALDYPSDTPQALARTIYAISDYLKHAAKALVRRVDTAYEAVAAYRGAEGGGAKPSKARFEDLIEDDVQLLRYTDELICVFSERLRLVESAATDRLPRQIVPSFEKLVRDLLPDVRIMLRPQWQYNYSFTLADFREVCLVALEEYKDILPEIDLEGEVLRDLPDPMHVIAFPSLEHDNILLHSLLGHEAGHLLADRFLTEDQEARFVKKVRPAIEGLADKKMAAAEISEERYGALFYPLVRQQIIRNYMQEVLRIWRRALEELISDMVGALLFGPAALFSTFEFASQRGLDLLPSRRTEYYPPWRMRLREVHKIVARGQEEFFPIPLDTFQENGGGARWGRVQETLERIEALVGDEADKKAIESDVWVSLAYSECSAYLDEAKEYLARQRAFSQQQLRSRSLFRVVPALIERLDSGVPPNAFQSEIDGRQRVRLVHILNAAWLHRVASGPRSEQEELEEYTERAREERQRRNNLTVKALEYAWLSELYWSRMKVADTTLVRGSRQNIEESGGGGVITGEDLVWWLERPKVAERLVVTPLLNPRETVGSSSVDVRLGFEFITMTREAFPGLDMAKAGNLEADIERYQAKVFRGWRQGFVLHPGELVIGSTLEYIQLPAGLMCYVIGKSSLGRLGLIIATATKVDPGFRGCVTLEMINEGEVPLTLYPGMTVAQLVFHSTSGGGSYQGRYRCPIGPEFPKVRVDAAAAFWLPK